MESKYIDVLNQILWMHSLEDIVESIIKCGIGLVIAIVLWGAIQCFFGYKIYRFEMALIGMAGAAFVSYMFCRYIAHIEGGLLYFTVGVAIFIGGGMMYSVYAFTVFLFALVLTAVGLSVASAKNNWQMLPQIILICSFAVSLICTVLYKHAIILAKAFMGSGIIGCTVAFMMKSNTFGIAVGAAFFLCGLGVQYFLLHLENRKKRRRKEQERMEAAAKTATTTSRPTPQIQPKVTPKVQPEGTPKGQSKVRPQEEVAAAKSAIENESKVRPSFMTQEEMERAIRLQQIREEERRARMGTPKHTGE